MASLNRVFLIGNLTRDPEVSYLPSGSAMAKMGLAVNRKYQTADKQTKEEVCFVNIVVWGNQAENCGKYLKKGRPVFVEGRLRFEEWKDKEGQKRTALTVVGERVQFMGSPQGGEGRGDAETGPSERPARPAARSSEGDGSHSTELPPDEAPSAGGGGASADADDLPF